MKKINVFLKKYGIVFAAIAVGLAIIVYFVNVIVFENKKDVLTVLVLDSNLEIESIEEPLYDLIPVQEDEEIVVKYMDSTGEAEQVIILTWIRSRTIDVIIGAEESLMFYAQNECLMNLEEVGIEQDEKDYYNSVNEYSSDGRLIETGESTLFGKYVEPIKGVKGIENPIVSLAVNSQHVDTGLLVLNYYMDCK